MPKKIKLSELPELDGLLIITNLEEFREFTKKLRQDYYPPEKLEGKYNIPEIFTVWLNTRKPNTLTFFAVFDEEDSRSNGFWGQCKLYRCIAVRSTDGEVHVFKNLIENFAH